MRAGVLFFELGRNRAPKRDHQELQGQTPSPTRCHQLGVNHNAMSSTYILATPITINPESLNFFVSAMKRLKLHISSV